MSLRKMIGFDKQPSTANVTAPATAPRGRAGATFAAGLTFENLERRYGDTAALKGVNLDIAPGEVICLLGPSGCGKTTLLRITSGIEKPSGGRVLINGREVAGPNRFVPPEQRGVGLMFQDFALFPHLTILENVAFGLKNLPRDEARRESKAILARVGMERFADQYPHTLSASSSVWRWRGPSCRGRRWFSWTSLSPVSTCSSATACKRRHWHCCERRAPRR